MKKQTIVLSASGLKNIVLNESNISDEFKFIFGRKEMIMKNVFAEFISPKVSVLHQIDPTISSLNLKYNVPYESLKTTDLNLDDFSENIISYIDQISKGNHIEIKNDDIKTMKIISILLGNSELYYKLNDISDDSEITCENIDIYIQILLNCKYFPQISEKINPSNIINFISSHFYCISPEKLYHLPKSILYSIIASDSLIIESEDSLFEFIQNLFKTESLTADEDDQLYDLITFYEEVHFEALSESTFSRFVATFDAQQMTTKLWFKISRCFYMNHAKRRDQHYKRSRYMSEPPSMCERYDYEDGGASNAFKGIIHHLSVSAGGNVFEKGVVKVTASTVFNNDYHVKYVVDFDDKSHYFASDNFPNSWLKYDFQGLKIKPTGYSLRTNNDYGEGGQHLRCWVVEGSNSDRDDDWTVIDAQNGSRKLNDKNAAHTFKIEAENIEGYRYLRIRQTDKNFHNDNLLVLSALEYFGEIYHQN